MEERMKNNSGNEKLKISELSKDAQEKNRKMYFQKLLQQSPMAGFPQVS